MGGENMKIEELRQLIAKDKLKKRDKYKARKYYDYKPPERTTVDTLQADGKMKSFKIDTNSVYVNYFKKIVNQKLDYCVSAPISNQIDLNELPEFNFNEIFQQAGVNASLDTTNWLHFYIGENNRLNWVLVPDREILPIWDKHHKTIKTIIRYYSIDEKTMQVELWTAQGVQVMRLMKDSHEIDPAMSHYNQERVYDGKGS